MFRFWKVALFTDGFAPLMDAMDAGGAGGADPDGAEGADNGAVSDDGGDPADGVDAAGNDASREEALEDLLVDEDEPDQDEHGRQRTTEDRIKAISKKNRKLRRQLAKLLPLAKRLGDVDLDDLITRARTADRLEEQLQRNPRLRGVLYGEDEEPQGSARTRSKVEDEPEFDESSLPFDPKENEVNAYFAKLARQNHELARELKQVRARQDQFEGRDTARTELQDKREWKSAIDAASATLKDPMTRTLFQDALTAAFISRHRHGKTPQQIIAHYLKGNVSSADAKRATDAAAAAAGKNRGTSTVAAQQRIAERNRTLPRTVAPSGQPAPARTGRETLRDVHRRIRTAG